MYVYIYIYIEREREREREIEIHSAFAFRVLRPALVLLPRGRGNRRRGGYSQFS